MSLLSRKTKIMAGGIVAAAALALATGCTPPTLAQTPAAAKATVVDLIKAIPSFDKLLPKSLQAGSSTAARNLVSARVLGDVTNLDPAALPGVTAQGYGDLKNQITGNMVTMMLKLLQSTLGNRTVTPGQDLVLGTVTLPPPMTAPDGGSSMDIGVINMTSPASGETDIKWFIKVPIQGSLVPYYVYIKIVGDDPATMKVSMVMNATINGYTMVQVGSYDAAKKTMIGIAPPSMMSGDGFFSQLSTAADGSVTYFNASTSYKSVAYANDLEGGVVSSNTYNNVDSIWTEFYNGSGDLVMQQWGDSSGQNVGWATSYFTAPGATNLKNTFVGLSKPTTVYKKTDFVYDASTSTYTRTVQWSTDNSTWTADANLSRQWNSADPWPYDSWISPVWMASTSPAAGDSVYYYQSGTYSNWAWDSSTNKSTWGQTDTYQIGYTVPTPETYLGKSYYMQNTFLLKYLRPVAALANYQLKMKEGNTNYSWCDANWQNWQWSDTMPADWATIPNERKNTWTYYNFWLENTAFVPDSSQTANDPATNDPDKGDLPANNLYEQNYWLWQNGVSKQQKALVLSTTETSPVGWEFQAPALVADIKDKLAAAYSSVSYDSTTLQAQADALITMPNTSTFPTY